MKVREFIEELSKLPPEAQEMELFTDRGEWGCIPTADIRVANLHWYGQGPRRPEDYVWENFFPEVPDDDYTNLQAVLIR